MAIFYICLTVTALDHSNIKMMAGMVEQNDDACRDGDDDDLQALPTSLSLSLPERKLLESKSFSHQRTQRFRKKCNSLQHLIKMN